MIELSIITLLNTMAPRYCEYKRNGLNDTKATLLSYSEMHDKYPSAAIRKAVLNGRGLGAIAVAMVATTCPLEAIKDND